MITDNAAKVQEHSSRADSIVRNMLQHSRGGSGGLQPADINALLEEALNLTYHGMRVQDAGFNIKIEKSFDESIGKMNVVPQELSRAFLNIINNGCYEANRKKMNTGSDFSPVLSVRTEKQNHMVKISIRDNGDGVPEAVNPKCSLLSLPPSRSDRAPVSAFRSRTTSLCISIMARLALKRRKAGLPSLLSCCNLATVKKYDWHKNGQQAGLA